MIKAFLFGKAVFESYFTRKIPHGNTHDDFLHRTRFFHLDRLDDRRARKHRRHRIFRIAEKYLKDFSLPHTDFRLQCKINKLFGDGIVVVAQLEDKNHRRKRTP